MATGSQSSSRSFDSLPSNLTPVQANERRPFLAVQVFTPLNLLVANRQDNLDVARMPLIGVNAAVGPVRPPTGFLAENRKSVNRNRRPVETQ